MTGHETLIALRNRRLRPAAVAIHVGHVPPCQTGEAVEIVVAPDEPIERLDLRCLEDEAGFIAQLHHLDMAGRA